MVDISRKTYERNGVQIILHSDGILWLNEKRVEEELDHKNLQMTTGQKISDHGKRRHEMVKQPKNNSEEFL